jgi:hypothetical protein
MTQPDQFEPVSAANYDSFAGYAATSQADYEEQNATAFGNTLGPLSGVCALMGQLPFMGGVAAVGGYGDTNPDTGLDIGFGDGMTNGVQVLADLLCGFLTGDSHTSGTTPFTLFEGVGKILTLLLDNPFTRGLLDLINASGGLVFDMLEGLLEFAGSLLGFFTGDLDPRQILETFGNMVGSLWEFVTGGISIGTEFLSDVIDAMVGWTFDILDDIPFFGPIIGAFGNVITGLIGGDLSFLGSWWDDFRGLFGNPGNLGSGNPILGAFGSIPILGPLFSVAGTFLSSLFGGFDASKIISGTFADGLVPGIRNIIDTIISALGGVGTGISALFTSLTRIPGVNIVTAILASIIPGLDATKITSGLFPQNRVFGLPGALSFINDVIMRITDAFFGFLLPTGRNWTVNEAAEAAIGVAATVAATSGGLSGAEASALALQRQEEYDQARLIAQYASNAAQYTAALRADAAALAAEAQANAGVSGFFKTITLDKTFSNLDPLPSTDFAATGPTTNDLVVRSVGSHGFSTQNYIGVETTRPAGTYFAILNHQYTVDDQSLSFVHGDATGDPAGATYAATLYTHSDAAHTVGAYCRVFTDFDVEIGYYTRSGSSYTYTPFEGGTHTGTPKSLDRVEFSNVGTTWSVEVDGVEVLSVVNANVTFSPSNRYAAVSIDREAAKKDAFNIYSISMADVINPVHLGSGAKMSRTSTSAVNIASTSGNPALFPTSYFDTVVSTTDDFTVDAANSSFTVDVAGWYRIVLRHPFGGGGTVAFGHVLYLNGAAHEYSGDKIPATSQGLSSTWTVYLEEGDQIQAGYTSLGAVTNGWGGGDTGSTKVYFTISLMNRSFK